MSRKVVIVGGGFAGLNAAKSLANVAGIDVTVVDRKNYHLFQPLLYQVATAGLNPADIAAPIRSILSRSKNTKVLHGEVIGADLSANRIETDFGSLDFDYLLLACGVQHSYFGNDDWEPYAPGLKTIENATDIRRRILTAYEKAELNNDPEYQKKLLTFVIVGGGPTGVELAGAIGEMSRFTLAKDFRTINAKNTRVFLMEAGPRILAAFPDKLADRAARDLESLGVQIWANSKVTDVNANGVQVGNEWISAATVIWAAGVQASSLPKSIGLNTDNQGRVIVNNDLSIANHHNVFAAGDLAHFDTDEHGVLPGLAPVAAQQGKFFAENIKRELKGNERQDFKYVDKGIMATIGRNKAIAVAGRWHFTGRFAWITWLFVHIFFLTGFRNRLIVVMQWAWSYLTYRRGARLIVGKQRRLDTSPK